MYTYKLSEVVMHSACTHIRQAGRQAASIVSCPLRLNLLCEMRHIQCAKRNETKWEKTIQANNEMRERQLKKPYQRLIIDKGKETYDTLVKFSKNYACTFVSILYLFACILIYTWLFLVAHNLAAISILIYQIENFEQDGCVSKRDNSLLCSLHT